MSCIFSRSGVIGYVCYCQLQLDRNAIKWITEMLQMRCILITLYAGKRKKIWHLPTILYSQIWQKLKRISVAKFLPSLYFDLRRPHPNCITILLFPAYQCYVGVHTLWLLWDDRMVYRVSCLNFPCDQVLDACYRGTDAIDRRWIIRRLFNYLVYILKKHIGSLVEMKIYTLAFKKIFRNHFINVFVKMK